MRRTLVSAIVGVAALLALLPSIASARPFHVTIAHRFAQPPTTAQCETQFGIACYDPSQFETAYGLKPLYSRGLTGAGKTIVIVDSFGSPTAASDLATFDSAFGLPAPPSFKVIQPDGPVPAYDPSNSTQVGWAEETSLDIQYSHAIAPGANILLVETPVAETEGVTGFPQVVEAENYVINHHLGDVITQSFGTAEQTFPSPQSLYALRGAYINAFLHHVTVLASSGDAGATSEEPDGTDYYPYRVVGWPASDPLVTGVGGTQLQLDANGNRTAPDSVWNDTALLGSPAAGSGGVSTVFGRPFYQNGVQSQAGNARGVPDVSMSAAVNGAAIVYFGFTGDDDNGGSNDITPGFYPIGGTSEASPEFSGIVAIADQAAGHDLGLINPTLYSNPSALTDITTGNNTVSFDNTGGSDDGEHTVVGYTAAPGYDLASGLGTPNGWATISALAHGGGHGGWGGPGGWGALTRRH